MFFWTPRAMIKVEINGKWDEYPIQWDEKTFFWRYEANKYALDKSKEWLSKKSQIKKGRIFTKEEWVIHKICLTIAWILGISFVLVSAFLLITLGVNP